MNIGGHEAAQDEAGRRGGMAQRQMRSTGQLNYSQSEVDWAGLA